MSENMFFIQSVNLYLIRAVVVLFDVALVKVGDGDARDGNVGAERQLGVADGRLQNRFQVFLRSSLNVSKMNDHLIRLILGKTNLNFLSFYFFWSILVEFFFDAKQQKRSRVFWPLFANSNVKRQKKKKYLTLNKVKKTKKR